MKAMFSRRPSPATVIAVVALFVALSGSAYAAKAINGKNIVTRSTPGNKLKRSSVTSAEANERSIAKRMPAVPSVGPVRTVRAFSSNAFTTADKRSVTASCPTGQKAIGGGAGWVLPNSTGVSLVDAEISSSRPQPANSGSDNVRGWTGAGELDQNVAQPRTLMAVALCIKK